MTGEGYAPPGRGLSIHPPKLASSTPNKLKYLSRYLPSGSARFQVPFYELSQNCVSHKRIVWPYWPTRGKFTNPQPIQHPTKCGFKVFFFVLFFVICFWLVCLAWSKVANPGTTLQRIRFVTSDKFRLTTITSRKNKRPSSVVDGALQSRWPCSLIHQGITRFLRDFRFIPDECRADWAQVDAVYHFSSWSMLFGGGDSMDTNHRQAYLFKLCLDRDILSITLRAAQEFLSIHLYKGLTGT